jgi:photosystem II stability/assembly factor-like uncharacterized protein
MRLKGAGGIAAVAIAAAASTIAPSAQGANASPFNERLLQAFTYRNIAPWRMQARIAAIAVPDAPLKDHLYTFYVAPWIGGLWKTTNNGTTFEPVFEGGPTSALGAVALAPSNPNVVWVGTGDAFTSRTSYAGDGVYKSLDAGRTWIHMGLDDTQHIARIVIHPTDPDTVYVAAMGHLYSNNDQRGVFKTTDGGRTWRKVLYVNDRVGVIDLVRDPRDPQVLFAAAYDKQRLPWQMVNGGPGSGIYKTTDGGQTWKKLENGLPAGRIGRIGLAIYLKNPDILYAAVENDNPRTVPLAAPPGRGGPPPVPRGTPIIGGEVYRTDDGGTAWRKTSPDDYDVSPKGPYYFSQIFVDPANDQNLFVTQDGFRHSLDGGKTWDAPRVFPRMFGDVRTLWIDPQNPQRMIQGSDGGIAISYDGGRTSDAFPNIPIGSVYSIGVDMEDPYNVYAGLQDHENWKGPSNGPLGRVDEQNWLAVGDGDGVFSIVDPTDSRWLYTTREYGGHTRLDQKLGYETLIQPQPRPGEAPYRFLWEPPILISPHHPETIYAGAQMLLRSVDRGDHWEEISPDLSTHPADKILPETEGGVPGGIPWFAISSIADSPIAGGLIWAGTSDGNVQVTRDAGKTWTDTTAALTRVGARADAYVSRVFASSHVAGRAYVSKSGYKFDDFHPYLYRTNDFGATWTSIAGNLPNAPINVIVEDRKNPELLFVGNDAGVFVTIDGGNRWVKMNNNIPTVPIHDLLVHPRDNDLILASYGRGLWITNIAPLQEMTDATLAEDVHLFAIPPTVQRVTWQFGANDYLFGQKNIETRNEPNGVLIRYYLKDATSAAPSVVITDASGREVAKLAGTGSAGINTVVWTMRPQGRGGRGAAGDGRGRGTAVDQLAPLGEYTVTLETGATKLTRKAQVTKTQGWSVGVPAEVIRERR